MTAYEKWKAQREQQAVDSFNEHVVTECVQLDKDTERLIWQKPGSFLYKIIYIRYKNTLFVSGDCYEGTYMWSEPKSLEWMADTNFDYFLGKCRATSTANSETDWIPQIAREEFDRLRNNGYFRDCDPDVIDEAHVALIDKDSWAAWLNEYFPEYYEFSDIGEVPSIMPYMHWYGLNKAMRTLTDKAAATTEFMT